MRNPLLIAAAILAMVFTTACPKTSLEVNARNSAAVLYGLIKSAQGTYGSFCGQNPTASVCQTINRAVDGQRALITAAETYCGWAIGTATDPKAVCHPVKDAESAFLASIANARELTLELKGLVHR